MRFIINFLYILSLIIISPKILYRVIFEKRYRKGWSGRLGWINRLHPGKKCIWIHAVSVGEVNAVKTLVKSIKTKFPEYEIVISSTTDTGFTTASSLYSGLCVFYFPFDLSWIMQRAFGCIRPDLCLLMELELWPNLTRIASRKNIPVVVVNGRISDRSFPRYRLIRPLVKPMFSKVALVLAQTEEYAKKFIYLGCPPGKVQVTNSLKYDTAAVADKIEGAGLIAKQLNITTERLWVAGGTGPAEEKILFGVFAKLRQDRLFEDLRLVVVPRKPERFDEVAALVGQYGFASVRYSDVKSGRKKLLSMPAVVIGDTMGDLRRFYSLAAVIFVGRSLVPMGGSDMMEAAALGRCIIFGPHTFNFRQSVEALLAGDGAIEVRDGSELLNALRKCLTDKTFASQIARNGQDIIRQNQGATERTVKAIEQLLANR